MVTDDNDVSSAVAVVEAASSIGDDQRLHSQQGHHSHRQSDLEGGRGGGVEKEREREREREREGEREREREVGREGGRERERKDRTLQKRRFPYIYMCQTKKHGRYKVGIQTRQVSRKLKGNLPCLYVSYFISFFLKNFFLMIVIHIPPTPPIEREREGVREGGREGEREGGRGRKK